MTLISVVIPAFNEEVALVPCLDSLVKQKTSLPFEVIVVNNNSTDKTAKVARSYTKKLNIRVIHEKRKGRGRARHTGFELASGEIIFSTDADAILPKNWIDELASYLLDQHFVAVSSHAMIDDPYRRNRMIFKRIQSVLYEIARIANGHPHLNGFSFAIKKDAYIRAGKINYRLKSLDDVDLSKKVARIGRIKFLPNMYVLISNRRYRDNLFRGVISYVKPYVQTSYFGKSVDMSDIR